MHNAAAGPTTFTCVSPLSGVMVCRPVGDLDAAARTRMDEAFALCLARAARTVVIDCTHLGFCDSTALNALLRLLRAAGPRKVGVCLAAPGRQLTRLLDAAGATELFATCPTVARALSPGCRAALRSPR